MATVALAGCGLGAGSKPDSVSLLVTQGFGAQTMVSGSAPKIVGADTVMRMLERNAKIDDAYGGGFVRVDRRSRRRRRAATGSTTSTESRRRRGRRTTKLHSRRSRLVGSPRLERDRGHPGRRRLLSRALRRRLRRPAATRCGSSARSPRRSRAPPSSRSSPATSWWPRSAAWSSPQYNHSLRVVVGAVCDADAGPGRRSAGARAVGASGVYARFEDRGSEARAARSIRARGAYTPVPAPG